MHELDSRLESRDRRASRRSGNDSALHIGGGYVNELDTICVRSSQLSQLGSVTDDRDSHLRQELVMGKKRDCCFWSNAGGVTGRHHKARKRVPRPGHSSDSNLRVTYKRKSYALRGSLPEAVIRYIDSSRTPH